MADNFNISDVPESAGPKSVEVPGDIADGTAGELLTWDAAGVAALVATGAATQVLTSNGAGTEPTFQAGGGGASSFLALTDTPGAYTGQSGHPVRVNNLATALEFAALTSLGEFTANDAVFVGASAAAGTARNGHSLIAFDDTVLEEIIFEGIMRQWYNPNESLQVILQWAAATAVVGVVRWIVQFENLAAGGQDLDVDGFAGGIASSPSPDGTSGVLTYSTLSFTNAAADAIAAGNAYRLRVQRDAADGSDTMVGDAQLLSVALRMA
jgi:hypothetical protein